jgi:tetratricopeptide (TPR) repeat protein
MRKLALALILIAPTVSQAGELRGIIRNNEGVSRTAKGKSLEAYDKFTQSMVDLPFSGTVHYNLGNTFLGNKEYEKALSEYQQAIRLSHPQDPRTGARDKATRFHALFNAAVALTELKRVDEALSFYQAALELEPDSIETKTNIELLTASAQGGGGEGDQKDKDKKDGEGKGDKKEEPKDGEGDKEKQPPPSSGQQKKKENKPKPFKSEDLSEQDMNRIMEEIKRQEEQIRAKSQREGAKDAPPDKDW